VQFTIQVKTVLQRRLPWWRHPEGGSRDQEGGIWLFDLNQGLFRLADCMLTRIANALELEHNYRVLCADREGRIWVGQPGQVALYGHRKSQIFGTSDGVPPGRVWTIFHEHAGSIWVGGEGGPSKFDNDRFRTLSQSNGLPAESIFGMPKTTTATGGLPPMLEF
jgi:ligand-binding sensor domain-containing protein